MRQKLSKATNLLFIALFSVGISSAAPKQGIAVKESTQTEGIDKRHLLTLDVHVYSHDNRDLPVIIVSEGKDIENFDHLELYYTGIKGFTTLTFPDIGRYDLRLYTPTKFVIEEITGIEGLYNNLMIDAELLEHQLYRNNCFLLEQEVRIDEEYLKWGPQELEFVIPE